MISVCIPAYNNQAFIAATLESVLKQTCRDLEIFIADDCSTDATVSVIKGFSDPRIRLVENKTNLGIGGNWRHALSGATGKYVKLLCGDDLIYPACLEQQLQALENPAHARAVLTICGSDVINPQSEVVLRRKPRFGLGQVSGTGLIRNCVRWGTNFIGEPAVGLFRREVLSRAGPLEFGNPYLVDLDLWAALLKHGDAFVDENRLAAFRISAGALSTKLAFRQAAYFRSFIRQLHSDPVYRINTLDTLSGKFFVSMVHSPQFVD